jgi:hypothetical protein
MWLSERNKNTDTDNGTQICTATIGGESVGVYAGGERRGLTVCAPGGYRWRPKAGDKLLVIKCAHGEEIVAGVPISGSTGSMKNGEVCIESEGGATLYLKNDGSIVIKGDVNVEGALKVNGNEIS